MPLKPSQIWQLLHSKQADFRSFDQKNLQLLQRYRQTLPRLAQLSKQELTARLLEFPTLAARPLEPLGQSPNWVIPFHLLWQNREQSMEWVRDRLTGITTFAVDGSQIFPSKDISIPVALIQIGWFENPHLPLGTYEKDVWLEIMTPAELQDTHQQPADRLVNMRRFQLETERLISYIEAQSGNPGCLVFLDGALVATFAEAFDPDTRSFYVQCLLKLLRASETHQIPLVAYIDTSYASDLVGLVEQVGQLPAADFLNDAQLFAPLMEWGDRTPLFICQRGGENGHRPILRDYQEQAEAIGFTYLKTHSGYPARLEIPLWVYEAGLLERVIDWVRGEVIIGNGYPYVIETADQTAVLQMADRQTFYRILQEWAEQENLKLRFSRKMVSKVHRR
uniref:NurA domain-containing protein n=1 Tax=Cyanothece sp. (strain PCC 7425 / ATCC 29141) TaxID=395961 RepID=B8HYN8_CYAP4